MKILDIESEKIIFDEFATYYSEGSIYQYRSAVIRFCENAKIESFQSIKYSDFLNYGEESKYIEWFIRYLYAHDYIDYEDDYPEFWVKYNIIQHYQKKLSPSVQKKDEVIKLSSEDIIKIENHFKKYVNSNSGDIVKELMWYMLFNTDCEADELRKTVNMKDFDGTFLYGKKDNKYFIPIKYREYINQKSKRRSNTKFSSLATHILDVGKILGLDDLTPFDVKSARSRNLINCPNCNEVFTATEENWVIIENRLVCSECGEKFEKKKIIRHVTAENKTAEIISEDKKDDFDKLNELRKEVGELGESYVYEYEKKKLDGTVYKKLIDPNKANDHTNGYDILSYTVDGEKLYIEVKTSLSEESQFYLTQNELNKYNEVTKNGGLYYIYRVTNIKDSSKTNIEIIKNIDDGKYVFQPIVYKIKPNYA